MINDFVGSDDRRRTPKRIEPLQKEPARSIHELAAEHEVQEAREAPAEAITGSSVPRFVPPEEVAESANEVDSTPVNCASQVKPHSGFFSPKWTLNRKWTIAAAVLAALLLSSSGVAAYYLTRPSVTGGTYYSKNPPKPAPKIITVANTLSGLQVDASVNDRPVTGVMIENSQDARPQSGLNQASVVFEAIAEGGVTRFLALFQDTQPDYIGPVRSARPYYVQWCMGFDCAYAHAGGSPEALANIRAWGTKDLNDTRGIFWRVDSRYAPHNLYTSIAKLNELEASKGYGKPSFTGFTRKADQPFRPTPAAQPGKPAPKAVDSRTTANAINLNISSGIFNARFDYDAKTNSYARSQAGGPHMTVDAAGNQAQITSKVVIAIVTSYGVAADKHSQYGVVGSGQAVIFQDGTVTPASWSKGDTAAPLRFTDAAGKDVALNAGQTWITALSGSDRLSYQ